MAKGYKFVMHKKGVVQPVQRRAEMTQIFKTLTSIMVWFLCFIGGLSFLISPMTRYITGEDFWLWIALGISFIAFTFALIIIKFIQAPE